MPNTPRELEGFADSEYKSAGHYTPEPCEYQLKKFRKLLLRLASRLGDEVLDVGDLAW